MKGNFIVHGTNADGLVAIFGLCATVWRSDRDIFIKIC